MRKKLLTGNTMYRKKKTMNNKKTASMKNMKTITKKMIMKMRRNRKLKKER